MISWCNNENPACAPNLSLVLVEASGQLSLAMKEKHVFKSTSGAFIFYFLDKQLKLLPTPQFPRYKLYSKDWFHITRVYLESFRTEKALGNMFLGIKF